jgi:hypothetical protein
MGNHPTTRSRAYREGWLGRRRTYRCRTPGCPNKFQVDTRNPLPEKMRVCPDCREKAERDLSIAVGVAIRQGVYWRPDAEEYMGDAEYQDWLDEQKEVK